MIKDKRPAYGAVPGDLDRLGAADLLAHMTRLQGERVALVGEAAELRDLRDGIGSDLTRAKLAAEARALAELPAGRGSDTPAASAVKSYVDADAAVLEVVERKADQARDLARNDDELGAVRSALRIVEAIHADRLEGRREATTERMHAYAERAEALIAVAEGSTTDAGEEW